MNFLLNTRLGQSLLLTLAILLSGFIAYKWADGKGYARCQAEHTAATNTANVALNTAENKRDDRGAAIAKEADTKAAAAQEKIDTRVIAGKETVRIVYRDRPTTAPIRAGSCVHPLDPKVQDTIDAAVAATNRRK